MIRFHSLKIRQKLTLIITSIVFVIVLLFGLVDLFWQRDFQHKKLLDELQALAELIGSRSDAALAFNDQQLAMDNLVSLKAIQHISHACLYRVDGTLLGEFFVDENFAHCQSKVLEPGIVYDDHGVHLLQEVLHQENVLGWVQIGSDLSTVNRQVKQQALFVMGALLIAVALGVLMAGRLQRIISGPLERITRTAHLIESEVGNKLRVSVEANDEVGQLAQSFNTMLDALEHNKEQLIAAKDEQLAAFSLYRNLIESTSAIPWEMDPQTWAFTFIGHQAEDIFGFPLDEWFKPGFLEQHIHRADVAQLDALHAAASSKDSHAMEFRIVSRQGKVVWVRNELKVIFKRGFPVRMQGFMLDISESREHEEALKNIAAGVSAGTGEYFFEQLAVKLAELFSVEYTYVAVPHAEKPGWVRSLAFCHYGEISKAIEYPLEGSPCVEVAAGEVCIHESNVQTLFPESDYLKHMNVESYAGVPLIDAGGNVLGLIVLLDSKPFTQRAKATEILTIFASRAKAELERVSSDRRLREKEYEQRQVLDSMVDSVVSIDETGVILTFNKAAEKMFGYANIEIIGQDVKKLMPDEFARHHDQYLDHYLTTGQAKLIGLGRNVEGKRKNGELFPMRLSIAELPRASNGKRRFVGSCMDMTLIKNQEEMLRRTQKMDALGKLTGGVAHDFNNILGIILGYSDLLGNMLNENPKLQNYATEIKNAGERGAKLTKKLLSFSRASSPDSSVVDINELLMDQQHMLEKTLTARIDLVFDLEERLWSVELDRHDFDDAALNMSINAMHSIDGSGYIKFKTRNVVLDTAQARQLNLSPGDYVSFSIIDTGCGMDEATREHIFDPFYSTKGEGGTGLGLTQVYGFVQRSHGAIKVSSDSGAGSDFTLYFPRSRDNEAESDSPATDVPPATATAQGSILVVDDEPALLALAEELLEDEGYRVVTAGDARQAIERLKEQSFDLVISDVIMPEMNGFELASYISSHYPDIKIQLVSGFTDDKQLQETDTDLRKAILRKPVKSATLVQRVRELLD